MKNFFKFFLRFLAYAVAIWALLELSFFLLNIPKEYKPHTSPEQFKWYEDSGFPYTNPRSLSYNFVYDGNPRSYFHYDNTVQYSTNAAGFRGPEIMMQKPSGKDRIFFLGDSFTFGEGVYFEDTFPEQFKKIAEEKRLFGDKKIEAINWGVGGYNTSQEYTALDAATKAKLDPDRIVVQYAMNDAEGSLFTFLPGGSYIRHQPELELYIEKKNQPGPIFKTSRVLGIVRNWYVGRQISAKTVDYYHKLYTDANPNWAKTKQAIADFGQYQKQTGTPVTFIIFPLLFELKNYPFAAEEQKIKDELEKNGIAYVNLRDYLKAYNGPELWVHPTDQHPNEIAHRIAAEALAEKMAADK